MRIALACLTLMLAGCDRPDDTAERVPSGNPAVRAERIAEVDGCIVYWVDAGRGFYFVRCPASDRTMSTRSWTSLVGRVPVTHHMDVEVIP